MTEEFETIELEYSEDDILYYIEDESGVEIGFALQEDGAEVEYYYEGFDAADYETTSEPTASEPAASSTASETGKNPSGPTASEKPESPNYLQKLAAIAGHEGNKARKVASEKLDQSKASEAKAKADEAGLGITREGVKDMTSDLNVIAKEGVEVAKELKGAYDDIMDNFGFLIPKNTRRR